MNLKWTLHVENFARVREADIQIAPLVCFIGDNNSGKSYLMSLLWGLLKNSDLFYNNKPNETATYHECREWISAHIDKRAGVIDEDSEQIYVRWFNELLAQNKDRLMRRTFNTDLIQLGDMRITDFSRMKKLSVKITSAEELRVMRTTRLSGEDSHDKIGIEIPADKETFDAIWWKAGVFVAWNLLMLGLTDIVPFDKNITGSIYLPASRTGFLLARREIALKSIAIRYSLADTENAVQETLTAPYIQFIQLINSFKDTPKFFNDVRKAPLYQFLKDNIISGDVESKLDGQVIKYIPNDLNEQEFPMSISSSVVTETASLLLLLAAQTEFKSLIIEEPEAHLHPDLQKKIAQLIVRFVHSGIPVWITTHSDIILQHFNNMIKLSNRPAEEREALLEKFNYTDDDLLTADEIALYQFNRYEQHTAVQKLNSGKYGFVIPSFNDAIQSLLNEIFAFQGDD